ncbi:MAG TPA: glycosyltransferase 87 family protein, partial [Thermoanaerobaculia bacterium]|nr:glycosyltransferase 87 family protein [Thermoanaerobaculia bacterium]
MIRRHRFPLAFLALVAAMLFLAPLAKREVFQFRDHLDYFQPLRWFTAMELREGRLPLWNPYSASGEPWMANPQTGVFYPPAWIFLVLPFATAYMLFLLFHLVVLAWGSYLLLARWNAPGAAMVGAAAILLSGPVLSLLDVSNNLATLAWIPLALWCAAEGAWRRGGVVLALAFLAGEPFFAALAALLFVVIRRRRDVAGTALIAFGLSAVQLLPFLEMVRGSDRTGGMDAPQILQDSMTPREWLRVVLPPPLIDAPPSQWFIPVAYGGAVVALLALAGLTTLRRRRDVAAWLLLLAGAVLVSTGPEWLARLPVTLFRYPSRLVPLAMLAIGALAAAGWNRLRADKRWLDLLVIGVIAADLLPRAVVLLQSGPFDPRIVPFDRSIGAAQKFLSVH